MYNYHFVDNVEIWKSIFKKIKVIGYGLDLENKKNEYIFFVNYFSEIVLNPSSYLTSAPISVNVNPLLQHICSRTSHLTL